MMMEKPTGLSCFFKNPNHMLVSISNPKNRRVNTNGGGNVSIAEMFKHLI
jgi:hypothetical protein